MTPRGVLQEVGRLALPIPLGLAVVACAPSPLPALPQRASATGVEIRSDAAGVDWVVQLAGAEGNVVSGEPVRASATTVARKQAGRPPLEIVAARSDWNLRERTAVFDQDVVVTRGDVTLTCTHLDVRYAGTEQIETVVATGSVRVLRGARQATADRAELDGKTGRVTLTGNPRLGEGASELVGDTITLWLDDERATCEGAAGGKCRLVVAGTAIGP